MACIKVLYSLALSDGHIDPQEWDMMHRLAQSSHNPAWATVDLLGLHNRPTRIEVHLARLRSAPEETKHWILDCLVQLAVVDNVLHPEEKEALNSFAMHLSLTSKDVEDRLQVHFDTIPHEVQTHPPVEAEPPSPPWASSSPPITITNQLTYTAPLPMQDRDEEDDLLEELLASMRKKHKKKRLSTLMEEITVN